LGDYDGYGAGNNGPRSRACSDTYRLDTIGHRVAASGDDCQHQYAGRSSSPTSRKNSDGIAPRSTAFTLFVLFETWVVPIEGWFVDKYGRARRSRWRHSLRPGLGDQRRGTSLKGTYFGMIVAGIGRRRRLRHLRRQCTEMVSDKRGLLQASPPQASARARR